MPMAITALLNDALGRSSTSVKCPSPEKLRIDKKFTGINLTCFFFE